MPAMDFVIAYVADAPKSAALYERVLEQKPVTVEADFAMFVMPGGAMRLGLWTRKDVLPPANGGAGAVEIGIPFADAAALHSRYAEWQGHGLKVLQPPTEMDFGLTFTVADSDGHRIRGYVPARR